MKKYFLILIVSFANISIADVPYKPTADDELPTAITGNAFVDALRSAGIENDVHVYDHVLHGFWLYVDEKPVVRSAPALDARQRLRAYFKRTFGD